MNCPQAKIGLVEQNSILLEAKMTKEKLSNLLKKRGRTYDSLRYEVYEELPPRCMEPIETLDMIERATDRIPAVSFFSGAGGGLM